MDNLDKKIKEEFEKIDVPTDKVFQAIEAGLSRSPKSKPFWLKKSFITVACVGLLVVGGVALYVNKNIEYTSSESQTELNSKAMLENTQKTNQSEDTKVQEKAEYTTDEPEAETNNEASSVTDPNRKIISTVSMELESKEFSKSVKEIESLVKKANGYIENYSLYGNPSSVSPEVKPFGETNESPSFNNRTADFVLRIPEEKVAEVLPLIEKSGRIISKNTTNQDITLNYQDTESRKKVLLLEQDKLMELLGKATNVDEMIVLEKRLSEIRVEIENLESQLRSFDNQINYTTIYVSLRDVKAYTESVKNEVISERISEGFKNSLIQIQTFFINLIVWILANSLYLLLVGLIGFGSYYLVKKKKLKKTTKKRQGLKSLPF